MDSCTKNLEKFVDFDNCLELINQLRTKIDPIDDSEQEKIRARCDTETLIEKFRKLIDSYQEQPELLEPHLKQLILLLIDGLNDSNISGIRYHATFKFLYQLIKVIGFKSISEKFPHETDKLPLLIEMLSKEDVDNKFDWQTRYVLTVWLSIVILTPFDLSKFDSNESAAATSMTNRIYSILKRNLSSHDSCQHVSSYCMAKFLSRPDILKERALIDGFVSDAMAHLQEIKIGAQAGSMDDIQLIGCLRTLCYMFKFFPRTELSLDTRCSQILNVLIKLEIEKINRELINHIIIKLLQRAGLALLPKRLAAWRYKRGSRILGQSTACSATDNNQQQQHGSNHDASSIDSNEEEVRAAEFLEPILSTLFVACQNGQTKIRWSAAKGIARLASRLSRERAGDVVDMVVKEFFTPTSSEFAWHGGCLTLAEMSRNGLILEEKLAEVIKIIGSAIIYDKIKGSFAVGAHVREAACYVCWAIARYYEDNLLAPYISPISINLLCTMLFDRELQCRRAASATFQELVGRQGTFNEEGIAILSSVDYSNVGQRQMTYLQLALQVAKFGSKYSQPFTEHLIEKKIGHWDIQIRRQASDSLSALMLHLDHEFISEKVLPPLMTMSEQNLDNNLKHGAILALAKVLRGLVPLQFEFNENLIEFMGNLVKSCEKQLKSKQQAPNFIEAIGFVISSCELASFNYDNDIIKQWESISLTALDSDHAQLREIGSEALLILYKSYYKNDKTCQDKLLAYLNRSLASMNESSRCGALRALSKLSQVPDAYISPSSNIRLDSDTPNIILMSITSYISKQTHEKPRDIIFAQAKAEACEALVNFISSLDKERLIMVLDLIRVGYDVLLEKTEDYSLDKRGDIGVVVRRASIKALQELTLHLLSLNITCLFDSTTLIQTMMAKILQQCVSYNNSARESASMAFYKLISSDLSDHLIPHKAHILRLLDLYKVDDIFNWRDEGTPIFVNLLSKSEYSEDLWLGLLPSVGQVSDMCAKQFRDSLSDYLKTLIDELEADNEQASKELQFVYESFYKCLTRTDSLADRLLTSGLVVTDFLLTQGLLNETSQDFQMRLANLCWNSRVGGGQKQQSDPKRLVSIARVLSSMLQFNGQVQRTCLKYCLRLLVNGYARVRVYTAEQLYLSIMIYQSELEENLSTDAGGLSEGGSVGGIEEPLESSAEGDSQASEAAGSLGAIKPQAPAAEPDFGSKSGPNLERAMELLCKTEWSEPLEKVKLVRDELSKAVCLLV